MVSYPSVQTLSRCFRQVIVTHLDAPLHALKVAEAIVKDALAAFEIQTMALAIQRHMPMVPLLNIVVRVPDLAEQLNRTPLMHIVLSTGSGKTFD